MRQDGLLDSLRRAIGRTAEGAVTYRVTLERGSNTDRETYVQRAESLTDGLEPSIRDAGAGSFESVGVARTADPYSRKPSDTATSQATVADIHPGSG